MRYPVDGRISQGFHAGHQAVDIAGMHRAPVYAPHAGRITHAGQLGSGTNDAGLAIDINGGRFVSRLGHNDQIIVSVGQNVAEGQHIGYQGFTGYTQPDNVVQGSHVHWVLWDNGTRVDGRNYITAPAAQGADNNMFNTKEEIFEAYLLLRGTLPTEAEWRGWLGQSKQRFFQVGKPEADNYRRERDQLRTQVNQIQAALNAERAKPPKEVIKEVVKIVEKPVEVIKEVPIYPDEDTSIVIDKDTVWSKLKSLFSFLGRKK